MKNDNTTELTLIYNSDKAEDKKAKAFVESFPGQHIETIDLTKDSLTELQLESLANKMRAHIEDLLDPAYDDHIRVHKEGLSLICRSEMIKLMAEDPKIIHTPILVIGNRAYKYGSAYDLSKLDIPV